MGGVCSTNRGEEDDGILMGKPEKEATRKTKT
jgi:hypothetical protein